MDIAHKNVLITGANRGIGLACAREFARRKAHIFMANRTVDPSIEPQLRQLGALSVKQIEADLGSRDGVTKFLSAHGSQPIDILFNNAGQLTGGLLEEQPLDEIYSMLQVNIAALIHITHHYVSQMVKRGDGKIINQSSVSAHMHFPCASTYAASKAAVAAFTECIHAELKGTGVTTLLLITPGIETRMYKEIYDKYGKNMDLKFMSSIEPDEYAKKICKAVETDMAELRPGGAAGIALQMAIHTPTIFETVVRKGFKRSPSPS